MEATAPGWPGVRMSLYPASLELFGGLRLPVLPLPGLAFWTCRSGAKSGKVSSRTR